MFWWAIFRISSGFVDLQYATLKSGQNSIWNSRPSTPLIDVTIAIARRMYQTILTSKVSLHWNQVRSITEEPRLLKVYVLERGDRNHLILRKPHTAVWCRRKVQWVGELQRRFCKGNPLKEARSQDAQHSTELTFEGPGQSIQKLSGVGIREKTMHRIVEKYLGYKSYTIKVRQMLYEAAWETETNAATCFCFP